MLNITPHLTLFISYNPKAQMEQTLAMRLHTLGVANGLTMFLPDRYDSETKISEETRVRISRCDYFIMFSTKSLSNVVREEIECAFEFLKDKSKIIVIYDKYVGKNLTGNITEHFTPFYYDVARERQDEFLKTVIDTIVKKENPVEKTSPQFLKKHTSKSVTTAEDNKRNAIVAIVAVGLALLLLAAFSKKE